MDSGEELEERKRRWRIRRVMFGNTGAVTSCTMQPTRFLVVFCKQHGIRVDDIVDHLAKEKIV